MSNLLFEKGKVGKPPLQLIPLAALIPVSWVMQHGADRHGGPNNFLGDDLSLSLYTGALLRHIERMQSGEWIDETSGQPHVAHVAANALILLSGNIVP